MRVKRSNIIFLLLLLFSTMVFATNSTCEGGNCVFDVVINVTEGGITIPIIDSWTPDVDTLSGNSNQTFDITFNYSSSTPIVWEEYESNPVFEGIGRAYYPYITKIDETYHMYYADNDGDYNIAHTTSTDLINWNAPTLNVKSLASHPAMSYDESGHGIGYNFMLFYWDINADLYSDGAMKVAYSNDGLNFINDANVSMPFLGATELDDELYWTRGTYGPIQIEYNPDYTNSGDNPRDYKFMIYYDATTGGAESTGIMYCSDETSCNVYGKVVEEDASTPFKSFGTIFKDIYEKYHYFYGCGSSPHENICHATSNNGVDEWVENTNNPIFEPEVGTWRERYIGETAIIVEDNKYYMIAEGRDNIESYKLGLFIGEQTPNEETRWYIDDVLQSDFTNKKSFLLSKSPSTTTTYNIRAIVENSLGSDEVEWDYTLNVESTAPSGGSGGGSDTNEGTIDTDAPLITVRESGLFNALATNESRSDIQIDSSEIIITTDADKTHKKSIEFYNNMETESTVYFEIRNDTDEWITLLFDDDVIVAGYDEKEVMFEVNVPEGTKSGKYNFEIGLRTSEGEVGTVDVIVNVSPINLSIIWIVIISLLLLIIVLLVTRQVTKKRRR